MKRPVARTPRQKANDNDRTERDEATTELKRKYAAVYETPEGRVVLDDIIYRLCQYEANVIQDLNPVSMYLNGARRDIGNTVLKMIHEKVTDGTASNRFK